MKDKTSGKAVLGFIIVSLLIACSNAVLVWYNARSAWNEIIESAEQTARHVEDSFNLSINAVSMNAQAMATFLAADPRVAELLHLGAEAVKKEGGGAGGNESTEIRARLHEILRPGWQAIEKKYGARQLHFHLVPGATSFLRVHEPTKFGDNLANVRRTVVDAGKLGRPARGFETGRVKSGIRGVVPVFYNLPETNATVTAGVLEVGAGFLPPICSLKASWGGDYAVFLTEKHMKKYMWDEFLQTRFVQTPPAYGYVLEDTSNSSTPALLERSCFRNALTHDSCAVTYVNDTPFFVISFPFNDYINTRDNSTEHVGKVLYWQNIQEEINDYNDTLKFNIFFAAIAFIIIETLLFVSWKYTTRKLRFLIENKTEELKLTNIKLEQAIEIRRMAESNYRALFDNIPIGMFQFTQAGKTIQANKELATMCGYGSPEEFLEKAGLVREDVFVDPERFDELKRRLDADSEVRDFEAAVKRKDGSHIWTSRSVRRFINEEDLVVYHGFVRDISDQKKIEQLKEDLERITRHDLKSPIIGIINGISLLEFSATPGEDDRNMMKKIKDRAHQALDMIGRSLDLYKMEQGTYALSMEEFDLMQLLSDIRLDTSSSAASTGSSLEMRINGTEAHDGETFPITADKTLCYAVFSNLIKNAFEAAGDDAPVVVDTTLNPQGCTVKISNREIVPENIRDIFFNKFATSGKSEGTGLGTYSAKIMVEYQNGTINMDTSEEHGTTITVTLPVQPAAEA